MMTKQERRQDARQQNRSYLDHIQVTDASKVRQKWGGLLRGDADAPTCPQTGAEIMMARSIDPNRNTTRNQP